MESLLVVTSFQTLGVMVGSSNADSYLYRYIVCLFTFFPTLDSTCSKRHVRGGTFVATNDKEERLFAKTCRMDSRVWDWLNWRGSGDLRV
jgi:hypothetical protein